MQRWSSTSRFRPEVTLCAVDWDVRDQELTNLAAWQFSVLRERDFDLWEGALVPDKHDLFWEVFSDFARR